MKARLKSIFQGLSPWKLALVLLAVASAISVLAPRPDGAERPDLLAAIGELRDGAPALPKIDLGAMSKAASQAMGAEEDGEAADAETTGTGDDSSQASAATAADDEAEAGAAPTEPLAADSIATDDVGVVVLEEAPVPYHSSLEIAWFTGGDDLHSRAVKARAKALEVGATSLEPASRALLAAATANPDLVEMEDAVRLSPQLPIAHMALARSHWGAGEHWPAVAEIGRGLGAIPFHVEASLWLVNSVIVMFAAVLVIASVIFIVAVGVGAFLHASHDLGDVIPGSMPSFSRAALLAACLLLPLALGEGLLGLVLAMFALGVLYGDSSHRTALSLAAVLIVVGIYPVGRVASTALTAIDSDPVASAALSVMRGVESPAEIAVLGEAREADALARRALALRARFLGDVETAQREYQTLLRMDPADPVLLANLGSLHFRKGETEEAIDLYERAVALVDSPVLLFDLAQAYARVFRMEEYEAAMAQAQLLDPEVVSELSHSGDTSFVADLPQPVEPIRERLIASGSKGGGALTRAALAVVAPGRLGGGWLVLSGAFAVAALLAAGLSTRFEHSSTCNRCGRRICARCDGTVWSSQTCEACYRLFNRPETTDSALRMARLRALRAREDRLERFATLASLCVPGVGGLLAKRPDLSFVGLLLAVWAAVSLLWRQGVVPDPLAVGAAGPLAFAISGILALIAYFGVSVIGLVVRKGL